MEVYPAVFLQTVVLSFDTNMWCCSSYPTGTRFIFSNHIYSYVNEKFKQ